MGFSSQILCWTLGRHGRGYSCHSVLLIMKGSNQNCTMYSVAQLEYSVG